MPASISNFTENSAARRVFRVEFFWSGVGTEPLRGVFVECQQGVVTELTTQPIPGAEDWGNVAWIPPLVNAHCHLEFSQLREPLTPPLPFTSWISKTMAVRRENTQPERSIREGLEQSQLAGVSVLGEIVTQPQVDYESLLSIAGAPELTLFREVIGLTPESVPEQIAHLRTFLAAGSPSQQLQAAGPTLRRGISPHAPYTVRPELLEQCVTLARERQLPLTMHLAETRAELELLAKQTGEFAELLQRLNLWDATLWPEGLRPLDYLRWLAPAPQTLLAHGNYLDAEEIRFLAGQPQMSVVYCPRTHAFFQHEPHPWQELLTAGVTVALGTDGRGSNPDLQLWEEARFLARQSQPAQAFDILKMATTSGATALGREFPLEVGQPLCGTLIRPLEATSQTFSSWHDLLTRKSRVESVMLAVERG